MTGEQWLRIVSLKAENVKRLKAVEITPDGDVVRITGRNAQGKSSVLDAIAMALGGKELCPTEPIRRGQEAAAVSIDMGELRVTRRFNAKGSTLEVRNADGAKFSGPQAILDSLVGQLTFDPLEFSRMKPAAQRESLLSLLGIGDALDALDAKRAAAYDLRRDANREVDRLANALASLQVPPDNTPAEAVDTAALLKEIESADAVTKRRAGEESLLSNLEHDARSAAAFEQRSAERVRAAEAELCAAQEALSDARKAVLNAGAAVGEQRKVLESIIVPDTTAARAAIAGAQATNAAVFLRVRRASISDERVHALSLSAKHQSAIEAVDAQKAALLSDAKWPIEGLGFGSDGVTLNGLPWEQASSAEQLRASIAIAMSMNPRLRVLMVRDGSLLDADSLRMLEEAVGENGYQLWLETVGDKGSVGIVIEDGEVDGQTHSG